METIIRDLLKLFVAAVEVFLVYYLSDAFFERRLKKACYIIGGLSTVFLFLIDCFFDSIGIIVGGIMIVIFVIIFFSMAGFQNFSLNC